MDFQQTGLPARGIFRESFAAGWEKYQQLFAGTDAQEIKIMYLRGPVAMAHLVLERGGDCHQVAAAACLAGPAAFTQSPDARLDTRVQELAAQVRAVEAIGSDKLRVAVEGLSSDARLFLQVTAVTMLDRLTETQAEAQVANDDLQKVYNDTLQIYSIMRGAVDTYRLDTLFEIAAMKVTTLLDHYKHIWVRSTQDSKEMALA